jgi:ligand-binding SRPBCC domain-containing protein
MPTFERSIEIDAPIASVFAFHLDTRNAARIASDGQEIVSVEGDFPLVEGAEVVLKVKQKPLPTVQTWRVRVTEVVEPVLVVDELIKGPFASFRHEHRFAPSASGGTVLTDHIDWVLPGGPAGRLAAPFAAKLLEKSFTERQATTKRILEEDAAS